MRIVTNRLLSFLLGVALVIGGLTAIVDGLFVAANRDTVVIAANPLYADGRTTLLGDDAVLITCLALAAAGLALLVFQLWRRPPRRLPIDAPVQEATPAWADAADPADARWWISRRSGEQHLGRAIRRERDVDAVTVRLRRRRRRWRALVDVTTTQPATERPDVSDRVRTELDALAAGAVAVKTRVHTKRDRND